MLRLLSTLFLLPLTLQAEASTDTVSGVTESEIVIGMSNAQEGPAKALGINLKKGADVYFNKVNAGGGVHGRQIRVISYDDGYEPVNTIKNTKKLIKEDNVFALFGYVGTPTSKVAVPMASRAEVPYFGPFTGAEFLRTPVNPYVFNVRASYFDETEALVRYFVEELGIRKIGAFIQDDGYGAAGRAGIQRALEGFGLEMAVVGKYKRNTTDISQGLETVMAAAPEAVIMVGAYQPCAAFIKEAKAKGFDAVFSNISFVGTNSLVKEVGAAGVGSYISQVMPHPELAKYDVVQQFREDMKAAGAESFIGFGSLEGYIDALVFVEGLKKASEDLTRTGFMTALESLSINIGSVDVYFTPDDHQGLHKVYITQIQEGGKVVETMAY